MKKNWLTLMLALSVIISAAAQSSGSVRTRIRPYANITPVDTSYVEFLYHYTVHDPILDETREDLKILTIGQEFSKYSDYAGYQIDSIMEIDYPQGISFDDYHKVAVEYLPSWEAFVKDLSSGIMSVYDKVFMNRYVYEEPSTLISWELQPGLEEICGHTCSKAICDFRGRKWTAWYCPEIPIDNGPWKFSGLPGIILKVESDDGELLFEATAMRHNKRRIVIMNEDRDKTTREKFNKELEEYMTRPRQYHIANPTFAPKDKDGNIATPEFRRLFFNPIELE